MKNNTNEPLKIGSIRFYPDNNDAIIKLICNSPLALALNPTNNIDFEIENRLSPDSKTVLKKLIERVLICDETIFPYSIQFDELQKILKPKSEEISVLIEAIINDINKTPFSIRFTSINNIPVSYMANINWLTECKYVANEGLELILNEQLLPYIEYIELLLR